MSIERIKARLDELQALNDRHRRHLTGKQLRALPSLIAALRLATDALQAIVAGDLALDAASEDQCWDQLSDRRLAEIARLLEERKP